MSALPNTIEKVETAQILPVDMFHDKAVDMLVNVHEQLAELPKNPYGDDTPNLGHTLRELGVGAGDDFSMFLMGGVEQLAMGAALGAFGVAAGTAVQMGAEVGASIASQSGNNNRPLSKPAHQKEKSAQLTFKRAQDKVAPKKPQKPAAATSIMKKALKAKQFKEFQRTAKRRRALMKQMNDLKEKIQLLNVYKKQNITHVRMSADGKELNPLHGQPRLVHKPDSERRKRKMAMAPIVGMAAAQQLAA